MRLLLVIIFCLLISTFCTAQTKNYDQQWLKIDSLEHYRALKTAIPLLESLMNQAQNGSIDLSAKAHYVKALIFKNKYEIELELGWTDSLGGARICYLEIIDALKPRLLASIQQTKDPIVQSLLYASLADLLFKYQRDFYVCNNIPRQATRAIQRARLAYADATGTFKELEEITDKFQDSLNQILRVYQEESSKYLLLASSY
jgi:hypothetical protein